MESRKPSSSNMILEEQCAFLDLPGSMQPHHHQTPGMVRYVQETEQPCSDFVCNEIERREGLATNDYVIDEGNIEQNELGKCNDRFPWPRMRWTGKIVKTLITILSYVGEEASECTGSWKKNVLLLRKIGKWRCVSRVMIERGYHVSPQQCEDKFNNLNKTYKRLNELLGRGTSCKVVENPKLLGAMDISAKAKEEVKRLLASKHLFFEEMCSYHNGNRLFLPHDPDVVQTLLSVLRNEGTCTAGISNQISEVEGGFNTLNDTTEANAATLEFAEVSGEWLKQIEENEVADLGNPLNHNQMFEGQAQYNQTNFNPTCPKTGTLAALSRLDTTDLNLSGPEVGMLENHLEFDLIDLDPSLAAGLDAVESEKQLMDSRLHQLKEQKSLIKAKMLELQGQWLELEQIKLAENLELEKIRLENKRLKLANEYRVLELKRKRMKSKQSYA